MQEETPLQKPPTSFQQLALIGLGVGKRAEGLGVSGLELGAFRAYRA